MIALEGTHCNGNSVYIFLFWEQRGLSPNFHIHVSLSDLYSPRISLHISSSRTGRPIVGIYHSLTDTWMWKLGLRPQYSFSGKICFKFSAFCLCSAAHGNNTLCQYKWSTSTIPFKQFPYFLFFREFCLGLMAIGKDGVSIAFLTLSLKFEKYILIK